MATNYTGVDLDRYNAGNKFYSQDRYLQGIGLDKPAITFNPSNYDTGITSQYGNNSMYGTPNQGGNSMGATMPIGNFNQKDNLFEVGPMSGAAPGSFRAAQDIGIDQTPVGRFDGLKSLAGKAGNYGLRAISSQMGSQGGAMLGSMIPGGGILSMILGAGAGGKFGFDAVGREPTDSQKVETNFYGNQGNSPMQYLNPITGELEDSMMQGYNINSMYGKGIASALDKRLSTIINTINRPGYTGSLGEKGGLLEKLQLEREALANAPGSGSGDDRMNKAFGRNAMMGDPAQFFGDNQGDGGGGQEFGGPGEETAENMYAYGGRAGYSGGGLSKYEVFKLGELGYNTKGGKILEPFGGINVLRDILKVNKYAYGGIVGMYR
jgi:hypothetical protein